MSIRTRFAPSPTGYLHIGGARTALFNWLYTRHLGGAFVLRIEDTDRERSTADAVQAILDGMHWLGMHADEGPFHQSERTAKYEQALQRLIDAGHAYHCYCSKEELDAMRAEQMAARRKPRYDGRCRARKSPREGIDPVVRFRHPVDGQTVIDDMVRGRVVFDNSELDDLVIARSDGSPTYNFTVVVDDLDMRITHVIRGDDHLNNTPRQVNIIRALGAEPPRYAHLPMILGPDGAKLSKRHGAVSVMQYREDGFLPEAVVNYLVRLGWSHGDQEIFSLDEMIRHFDITDVNQSASAINPDKLTWLNQHYIMQADPERLADELRWQFARHGIEVEGGPPLPEVVRVQRERSRTMVEMTDNSRFFYVEFDDYEVKAAKKHLTAEATAPLTILRDRLAALPAWQAGDIHALVNGVAEESGVKLGKVAQPLRVAVAGCGISPPIDETLALLGRDRTLARIDKALVHCRDA